MENARIAIVENTFEEFRMKFWDSYNPTDESARLRQKDRWLAARDGE